MNELHLTAAVSDYDHVRDLVNHKVATPGMKINFLDLEIPEINGRFATYREWDVSECGLGKYVALRSRGDESIVAIPVFPTRAFRHSGVYVRADSPIHTFEELKGTRIGIPEWAQTAVVYARGFLMNQHGLELASVDWVRSGINVPGRSEKVKVSLPEGVRCEARTDKSLEDLLLDGELDAVISAMAPASFIRREGKIRRLLADPRSAEEAYWRETGIFPIMHVIGIRREIYDAYPWVAGNLILAFEEAKARSIARALDPTAWKFPVPFITDTMEHIVETFGEDYFPYGFAPNRPTLAAFTRYAYEQGVADRLMEPEELFAPTTLKSFKV